MDATSRPDRATVVQRLRDEGHRFDFFQAVRVLERIARSRSAEGDPARLPVGYDHPPAGEAVRFRAVASHAFPAGAIREVRAPEPRQPEGPPPEMVVAMLGLVGPSGVLPRHYTSLLVERIREKDLALRDFLDLFHHRTISLFYRAWEKYRFPAAYERSQLGQAGPEEDLFTRCLYCLVGLGTGGLRRRLEFDDEALLFYAGLFAHGLPSAVALEGMLADYFRLPTRLRQFQGQWLCLARDDRSALPGPPCPEGQHNRLGSDVVAGERVWNVESKFRVRLGPVPYAQFRRFVPSGPALQPLCQMVRTFVGPQFDFDVQLVLRSDEVPQCHMAADAPDPPRLGWNTWICSRPPDHDADDATFSLEGMPWITRP
jgi:type VI secretion system protein ImpH